jgi:CRISPR-associated protein Cmr5
MVEGNQDAYLWAQAEAIAYVTWLKKFANAFLESSGKD